MPRIKLNLSKLSILEKLDLAKQISKSLTGNASFPAPTPPIATLDTAASNLQTAHDGVVAARQEAKNKTAIQNQMEDELDDLLTRMGGYVSSVSGDDEALITSAGMSVQQPKASAGPPTLPQSFAAMTGDSDGEIDLSCNAVNGAQSYIFEMSLQAPPNAAWTHIQTTTKSSLTVTGLTSGTRYWFRVAAINANGQSGWSDISTRIAP
jgi:Fibronectin type III domain